MKGNCLTVSVRRRKTVLVDGTELSKEMMWGGENLKRATESGDFIESLVKEMKVLADEIDRFLEVAPDITNGTRWYFYGLVRRMAINTVFPRSVSAGGFAATRTGHKKTLLRLLSRGPISGTPKGSRTPNLLVRSQTLYPIELWVHVFILYII